MSSEKLVFRDTEVFKDPRFITDKILDVQTHFLLMSPSQRQEGLCKRRSFALTKNKLGSRILRVKEVTVLNTALRTKLLQKLRRGYLNRNKILNAQYGFTKQI